MEFQTCETTIFDRFCAFHAVCIEKKFVFCYNEKYKNKQRKMREEDMLSEKNAKIMTKTLGQVLLLLLEEGKV